MDFFLEQRKYRKIYDWVLEERPQNNRELMYQLNPIKFKGKFEEVESIWTVMWSKTLRWFYLIPLVIVIVVYIFEFWPIFSSKLYQFEHVDNMGRKNMGKRYLFRMHNQVENLSIYENSTVRDYVTKFEEILDPSDNIYKGESG